ncbi:hypothetical protein HZY62_06930 [Maribacter polysiphoniae]|uniref:Fibronectin type-III domain-containing protein n=2 Tax=Maribacter polysiphoniae TaxID=429344 RepID=A0ABR7VWH0_9FLAO|nr:hypothetical protein [Maribacter polysiphoniae]MBD1260314.1 hypothetical protein [Maribacter polysiphoniae]
MKKRSKMVYLSKYIVVVFFLWVASGLNAQIDSISYETPNTMKLVIQARPTNDAIMLRWGVNDKNIWKLGNEYGYLVERITLEQNGSPVTTPEEVILSGGPIKPRPLSDWQELIEKNDMAGVAAQAIYGENFVLDTNTQNKGKVSQIINQSSELQQRFAFSMFAIDQDYTAAQYAGLGFTDFSVKENTRYMYNIKIAAPEGTNLPKETGIIITTSNPVKLPKPYDFAGYYYNDAFVLIWEYDALVHFYNSYDLERSDDGISFRKLNITPITKLMDSRSSGIAFTDSIPVYEKKYWYRIKGRTIFNEISEPSDTISIIAYKKLLVAPELKESEIISDKEAILKWDFAKDEAWKLTGFDILRSDKPIGPYNQIKKNIEPNIRTFKYSELQDINYFKIRAKGIAGDYIDSSPSMIQPIDSIPPTQPKELTGKIDSTGVVTLTWAKNEELDLKGYTIFRANRPNQEFTRLNKYQIQKTLYKDTINLKSFNKNVYYKIDAVDNRYNASAPSEVLPLKRPDKIPPMNPLITNYELQEKGIQLTWINSISEDVVKHVIYRKKNLSENTKWEKIFEITDLNTNDYLDDTIAGNTKYHYTVIAIDQTGLESQPSPPISIISLGEQTKTAISGFNNTVDRDNRIIHLNWRLKASNIVEILLYKKQNESEFSLYQTFTGNRTRFIDAKLTPNTIYTYGLKAIFEDGTVSEWQETEVVY